MLREDHGHRHNDDHHDRRDPPTEHLAGLAALEHVRRRRAHPAAGPGAGRRGGRGPALVARDVRRDRDPGPRGRGRGAPRRARHPADLRRLDARPGAGPGLRARAGAVLRDGRPPARHVGPALRALRRGRARDRPRRTDARLAAGRRAGADPPRARRPATCSTPTPRASTPTSTTAACRRSRSSTPSSTSRASTTRPRPGPPSTRSRGSRRWRGTSRATSRTRSPERGRSASSAPSARASCSRRTPTTTTRRSSSRAPSSTGSSSRTPPRPAPGCRSGRRSGRGCRRRWPASSGSSARCRRCSAPATASAATAGSSAASTPRPARRSWPTTRTSGISLPGIWIQVGLHCREVSEACPLDVAGFSFSGVPGVIIGHNADIAWGFTNLAPDTTDLFVERVRDDRWQHDGRSRPLKVREETIEVRDGDDVTIQVRSTAHGPLLSDLDGDLGDLVDEAGDSGVVPDGNAAVGPRASRSPGPPSNRSRRPMRSMRSTSRPTGARSGRRSPTSPYQGRTSSTPTPRATSATRRPGGCRSASRATTGCCLRPAGWRRTTGPGEYVPYDALPNVLDPESGLVVTANQAVVDPDSAVSGYPYFLTDDWDRGYRSARIRDLLVDDESLDVDDMSSVQTDDRNPMAPVLTPYLLEVDLPAGYFSDGQRHLARVGLPPGRRQCRGRLLQRGVARAARPDLPRRADRHPASRRRPAVVRGGRGPAHPAR